MTNPAQTAAVPPSDRPWLDKLGSIASATCAVHCLVLAVLPAALPVLGIGFLANEAVEWALVIMAVLMAAAAAVHGYRVHRSPRISAAFGAGIVLLLLGRAAEELAIEGVGLPAALLGGVVLVAAHVTNLRCCKSCRASAASLAPDAG